MLKSTRMKINYRYRWVRPLVVSTPPVQQPLSGFLRQFPIHFLLHKLLLETAQISTVLVQKLNFQFPVFNLRIYDIVCSINLFHNISILAYKITNVQVKMISKLPCGSAKTIEESEGLNLQLILITHIKC
jgi:hypothetical protein